MCVTVLRTTVGYLLGMMTEPMKRSKILKVLKCTNVLNQKMRIARCYVDWKDGCLTFEALCPGKYDKEAFNQFLESWDHDTAVLEEALQELLKYKA